MEISEVASAVYRVLYEQTRFALMSKTSCVPALDYVVDNVVSMIPRPESCLKLVSTVPITPEMVPLPDHYSVFYEDKELYARHLLAMPYGTTGDDAPGLTFTPPPNRSPRPFQLPELWDVVSSSGDSPYTTLLPYVQAHNFAATEDAFVAISLTCKSMRRVYLGFLEFQLKSLIDGNNSLALIAQQNYRRGDEALTRMLSPSEKYHGNAVDDWNAEMRSHKLRNLDSLGLFPFSDRNIFPTLTGMGLGKFIYCAADSFNPDALRNVKRRGFRKALEGITTFEVRTLGDFWVSNERVYTPQIIHAYGGHVDKLDSDPLVLEKNYSLVPRHWTSSACLDIASASYDPNHGRSNSFVPSMPNLPLFSDDDGPNRFFYERNLCKPDNMKSEGIWPQLPLMVPMSHVDNLDKQDWTYGDFRDVRKHLLKTVVKPGPLLSHPAGLCVPDSYIFVVPPSNQEEFIKNINILEGGVDLRWG